MRQNHFDVNVEKRVVNSRDQSVIPTVNVEDRHKNISLGTLNRNRISVRITFADICNCAIAAA